MTLAKMFRSSRLGKAILVFCFLSTSTALICNILEYGALPDGVTNNTEAFQKAISACSQDPLIAIEQNQLLVSFIIYQT
jgi:polygalacturonase